jgi:hypothetical protein
MFLGQACAKPRSQILIVKIPGGGSFAQKHICDLGHFSLLSLTDFELNLRLSEVEKYDFNSK